MCCSNGKLNFVRLVCVDVCVIRRGVVLDNCDFIVVVWVNWECFGWGDVLLGMVVVMLVMCVY